MVRFMAPPTARALGLGDALLGGGWLAGIDDIAIVETAWLPHRSDSLDVDDIVLSSMSSVNLMWARAAALS